MADHTQPSQTGITAVIITLNEERNIGRCLESLQGVVDEVVVVDSHSTDRTREICEAHAVRFEARDWQGYSKTKNYANSLASQPYILSMDADEALSPELTQSILAAKQKGLSGIYSFNRLTNYCGQWIRHGGWYPDRKERLFPKGAGNWEGDFVHETIKFSGNHSVSHLSGDLFHYSYYHKSEHRDRVVRYSQLAAQKMLAAGKSGGPLKGFFSALSRFIRMYFFKMGFLDGGNGLYISFVSAKASYLRYTKLQQLRNQQHG